MKALKLVYLADRYHLRKYGRLITNDSYFAMNYGPVPSGVKDIAETSGFLSDQEREYALKYIDTYGKLVLKSVSPVDIEVFSESDIEAFDFAWECFGYLGQFELAKLTHEYPEWKRHEQTLTLDSRIQMSLEDFFEDSEDDINRCFELNDQERAIRREHLAEAAHVNSLWS